MEVKAGPVLISIGTRTKKKFPTLRPISIKESIIDSKPAIKYPGLTLESQISFFKQIKLASDKTAAEISILSELMGNIECPKRGRRRLLLGAVQSVLLYRA